MKVCINTDVENYGLPRFLIKHIEKMELRDDNSNIVFNIASISNKGLKKGDKCTLYLEGDEFTTKGKNKERYERSDVFYILQKSYLSYYPAKTKVLQMGVDPDWHYPRDIKKDYDYVFVGKTHGDSVYDNRKGVLEELQKSKYKILVTDGTPETYCDLMSSGRIILNVMPRRKGGSVDKEGKPIDDVCANFRILEGMAIGCMMTDYDKVLDDWGIIPNVHYLTLDRFGEDFTDKELQRIHDVGRKYVCENFSYQEAIKTIIKDVEEFLQRT